MIGKEDYLQLLSELGNVKLIAVSKTKPESDIRALYDLGQRHFGENYVQELVAKQITLPQNICWHFIGHLQRNKVKQIIAFVHLIHGVDSSRLLKTINTEAGKAGRRINVLLQVYIAKEESKFGLDREELLEILSAYMQGSYPHLQLSGLMGMASNTEDQETIRSEFLELKQLYEQLINEYGARLSGFDQLSMGMSSDYSIALSAGSTMVRIGSKLFGVRDYQND